MFNFISYLESSSIDGLSQIAAKKSNERVFWIFVVMTGFLLAGSLIFISFKSWAENPATTNIESLAISDMQIPFPKARK